LQTHQTPRACWKNEKHTYDSSNVNVFVFKDAPITRIIITQDENVPFVFETRIQSAQVSAIIDAIKAANVSGRIVAYVSEDEDPDAIGSRSAAMKALEAAEQAARTPAPASAAEEGVYL
jgi:hypothetical protein